MSPTERDLKIAHNIMYRPLGNSLDPQWWSDTEKLIAQAIVDERERCAKIAENIHYGKLGHSTWMDVGKVIATSIRQPTTG